jgi:serine phosphatase RsbU (regulator of sigma subunit)
MRLSRNILILTFVELLLLLLLQTAAGQTSDSLRFARLQKDMYRHYSTHNTKEFLQTVEHHVDGAGPSDDMTMLCLRMK